MSTNQHKYEENIITNLQWYDATHIVQIEISGRKSFPICCSQTS